MDPLHRQKRLEHVKQQLALYSGQKKEVGDRLMIICPFHAESTPSGSVNVGPKYAPGHFRCFACGHKASWDELAERIGVEPLGHVKPKDGHAINLLMDRGLAALQDADASVDTDKRYVEGRFKFWDLPKGKLWRTIPTDLLIQLQGQMCYMWYEEGQKWGTTKFIYFPVTILGEQRGFFRARLRKDADGLPSYMLAKSLDSSSGWSKDYGLWPFDHAIDMMRRKKSKTIVLVEGQRDALRLIMNGIPAMCICGTQSWTDNKAKLLEIADVERVVTFFDGDDAGIGASEKIPPSLQQFFKVNVLKLWKMKGSPYLKFEDEDEPSKAAKKAGVTLYDPGNCPQWIIDKIKSKFF